MTENPYQAPTTGKEHGESFQSNNAYALRLLRPPAIAMIIVAILGLLNVLAGAILQFYLGQLELNFDTPVNTVRIASVVVISLFHFVFMYGAVLMLQARDRKSARMAMMIACVPCCSPLVIVGIPFAIWALVVMNNERVIALFEHNRRADDPEYVAHLQKEQQKAQQYEQRLVREKNATQIVGQHCSICSEKVIFADEGLYCSECLKPYCKKCYSGESLCPACANA